MFLITNLVEYSHFIHYSKTKQIYVLCCRFPRTAQLPLCFPEDALFMAVLFFPPPRPSPSQGCQGHVHKPHLVAN